MAVQKSAGPTLKIRQMMIQQKFVYRSSALWTRRGAAPIRDEEQAAEHDHLAQEAESDGKRDECETAEDQEASRELGRRH
jgi:hypothetical protein